SGPYQTVGVLMMTVEVGSFVELQSEDGVGNSFVAVLVDRRADVEGRRGAILEHPRLAELRKGGVPEKELKFYMDPGRLERGSWDQDYTDPLSTQHADYAGRWLAASAPVHIEDRPGVRDTGWQVIVQEKYDTAIGPVLEMEQQMMEGGLLALL